MHHSHFKLILIFLVVGVVASPLLSLQANFLFDWLPLANKKCGTGVDDLTGNNDICQRVEKMSDTEHL